jgi:hypothetical protein
MAAVIGLRCTRWVKFSIYLTLEQHANSIFLLLGANKAGNDNGLTFQADHLSKVTFDLPKDTPAGQYLLRIEHIGLHSASSFGGAQFYISCAQIEVSGSSTAKPSPTVKIPGVYTGHEDSLELSIYYPIPVNYQPPGPAVWGGASSGSAPASSAPASSAASKPTTKAPVTSATTAAPTTMSTVVKTTTAPAAASTSGSSTGSVKKWQQCGGKGYTGATQCESGSTCKAQNDYYSQCI